MDIYGHTKEFMIIPERTTSTAFYAHLVSSLKKNLILMTETIKNLDEDENLDGKKIQCSRFCFISVGVLAVFLKNSYRWLKLTTFKYTCRK